MCTHKTATLTYVSNLYSIKLPDSRDGGNLNSGIEELAIPNLSLGTTKMLLLPPPCSLSEPLFSVTLCGELQVILTKAMCEVTLKFLREAFVAECCGINVVGTVLKNNDFNIYIKGTNF